MGRTYLKLTRMCPQAAPAPDGKSSGIPETPNVWPTPLNLSVTKHDQVLSGPMESPGESYAESESRLFARLFTQNTEFGGAPLTAVLGRMEVQQVLARASACKCLEKNSVDPAALRYVAHIYNCALGMDFQVTEVAHGFYLYSDGALRRAIEDLQEKGRFEDALDARSWSKSKLDRFLAEVLDKHPRLAAFLLQTTPQSPEHDLGSGTGTHRQAQYLRDIVIPTANRPKETARLLASLAKNFVFYGYDPARIQISVVDTSSSPETRLATLDVVEQAKRHGLQAVYLGPAAVRARLSHIAQNLSGDARQTFEDLFLRGLFSKDYESGIPITIGTVRNAISLFMAGRPYISLDDDMILDAVVPPFDRHKTLLSDSSGEHRGFDLHVGAANDYVNFAALEQSEFSQGCVSVPADFLGICSRNLDAPIYVTESRLVGSPGFSPFIKPQGRVSVVRPYISNASPDVTVFLRKFMQNGDVGELTGAKAPAYVPLDVPASCLFRGYSSGTMFATSSSAKVPFLDARAYEDVAQSQLTEFFNPHDVQFQGGTIEHRRSVSSRVLSSVNYVDILIGFHAMTRYLSNVYPDSFISNTLWRETDKGKALRAIGRRMYQDGTEGNLSQSDVAEFSRAYLLMGKRLRERHVEGAATFSTTREDAEKEIRNRHQVFLRTNGQLYYYWTKFAAAALKSTGSSEI